MIIIINNTYIVVIYDDDDDDYLLLSSIVCVCVHLLCVRFYYLKQNCFKKNMNVCRHVATERSAAVPTFEQVRALLCVEVIDESA